MHKTANHGLGLRMLTAASLYVLANGVSLAADASPVVNVSVDWTHTIAVSKTSPTLMVEVNPLLREGHALNAAAFAAIKDLGADYVRYHGQYMWPRLVVAELEPPTREKTFWDFSAMDSIVVPFLEATKGHESVLNLNTIPAWMFKTDKPVHYPENPDQFTGDYEPYEGVPGTKLWDPSGQQVAQYYARVVSWYTHGGFTDELGQFHASGHHYELPWWEVLNEVQAEHQMTPQRYVVLYDAIVSAIRKASPQTKFVGLGLAQTGPLSGTTGPAKEPSFFEYFLNPRNHRPNTSLDMIAYHFYAMPSVGQSIDSWQYTFFDQVDGFLNAVAYVESIRKRLSPSTRVNLDELGSFLPEYSKSQAALTAADNVPPAYWNLGGALFAYLYVELAKQGIDVIAASQFLGDPKDNPGVDDPMGVDPNDSIALFDWKTAKPNARFWVLKLLVDNFHPGDHLVSTHFDTLYGVPPDVEAQAFLTGKGKKLLVVNKRAYPMDISLEKSGHVQEIEVVDETTGENPARSEKKIGKDLHLEPFAVAVVTME